MGKTKFEFNSWLITNYKNYNSTAEIAEKWTSFGVDQYQVEKILTENNIDYAKYFQAKRDKREYVPSETTVFNFSSKQELMTRMGKYKALTVFQSNKYYFYFMRVKNKKEMIIKPPITRVIASWKGFRIKELEIKYTDALYKGKKKDWIVTSYYANCFSTKITLTTQPKGRYKITTILPENVKIITWKQAMEQIWLNIQSTKKPE